ncbi:Phage P2 baseplate assembly protein gpV [Serratia marcescens]|jgi:phage baseplate assembly protein V|nr:Phage P2 baseplate assembly protein gpV [Serratia marcescens]
MAQGASHAPRARTRHTGGMNAILTELRRRLANIVRIGTVSDVDTAKGLCRVLTGANETDWLNWLTLRAGRVRFWSAPSVGEQVIVLSIFGELTTGFVLPAVFSDQHPAPSASPDAVRIDFPDGAVIEYEPENSTLTAHGMKYADIQAAEKISATSNVVVVTAGQMITLDAPVVECTNKLIAGSLLLKYGGEMYGNITHTGGGFNSNGVIVHLHYHGNVQNGGGNTGGPTS